jgi:hypothetical protein
MSYLGLRVIGSEDDGFDIWAFDHAQHHRDLIQQLARPITTTGDTTLGSGLINNLVSVKGLLKGMGVSGAGIAQGSQIIGIDNIVQNVSISINATATSAGVSLTFGYQPFTDYILEPVNLQDARQFLQDHQLAHNALNGALGTQGNDLQDLDWRNEREVQAWLDLNWTEHQTWQQMTGIS